MPVYFGNSGVMDMDVVRLMGVSVKSDSAIGYFGTGLKYAIATLLRNGCTVQIFTGGVTYNFVGVEKEIRGKKFQVILMNGEQLGFTTDLGRDWELWQAYRELHSNCLDENGIIRNQPVMGETLIVVHGKEFEQCYHDRHKIFISSEPLHFVDGVEIHPGRNSYVFYRGVRVHRLPKESMFTYNITNPMPLTEDRTARSAYDVEYRIETRLPAVPSEKFAEKLLRTKGDFWENSLDLSLCGAPSDEFLDVMERLYDDYTVNEKARMLLRKARGDKNHKPIVLTEVEKQTINEACEFVTKKLNARITPGDFTFIETAGPNVMAVCNSERQMLISRQAIANGAEFLAITMYEEWIHKTLGFADESRGMQQFLFDKILQLAKEMP